MNQRFLKLAIIALLILNSVNAFAGGIEGYVKNKDNEPIEFATIYVKELGTGTTTYIEG